MMRQRVIHVLTHDSIGLGEDGPTHQPIEHLASLRAMPNLHVFRPADAMETAECWELAMRRTDGPSLLVLSRQALPALRTDAGGEPLRARRLRAGRGRGAAPGDDHRHRLGSADRHGGAREAGRATASPPPWSRCRAGSCSRSRTRPIAPRCWAARRASAIEAACGFGWERWLGPEGTFIGMTGFGASGKQEDLYAHFGITPEAVVAAVMRRLA